MRRFNKWDGTAKDMNYIVKAMMLDWGEKYPDLTIREQKSLLCAALASNLVQNEIAEQMDFWYGKK
jgi:hypothetical protein